MGDSRRLGHGTSCVIQTELPPKQDLPATAQMPEEGVVFHNINLPFLFLFVFVVIGLFSCTISQFAGV